MTPARSRHLALTRPSATLPRSSAKTGGSHATAPANPQLLTISLLLPLAIVELIDFVDLGKRIFLVRETIVILLFFLYYVLASDTTSLSDPSLPHPLSATPRNVAYAMSLVLLIGLVVGLSGAGPSWMAGHAARG